MVVILAIATIGLNLLRRLHRPHRRSATAPGSASAPMRRRWPSCTGSTTRSRCRSLLSMVFVAVAVGRRGLPHPAPARRLFLAADAGARGAHLHHRVPLDRGDRRRGWPRRAQARQHRAGRPRRPARLLHRGRPDRARRAVRAAARRRARRSAMCWWRSARTSCAPRSRAIRSSATSSRRSCSPRW